MYITILLIKISRSDDGEHIIYILEITEILSGFYYSYVVGLFLLPNYRLYFLVSLDVIWSSLFKYGLFSVFYLKADFLFKEENYNK